MKTGEKLWKKSILKSLIISFICILLPIYMLSITIYNWSIKTLRSEISNSMMDQVSNYLKNFEMEIQRIEIQQQDCFSDDNLNKLANIPEYLGDIGKMESILLLEQRLSAIKNSSEYISDVYAFVPAINKKIASNTFYELDDNEYNKLMPKDTYLQSRIMEVDNKMYISGAYPYGSTKTEKGPSFIIVIELSKDRIENALDSMVNNKNEGIILVNISNKSVVSTKHDLKFNTEIQNFIYHHKTIAARNAEKSRIGNRNYLAVYSSSSYLGDVLCKYTPEDYVFSSLRKYKIWFILLTIVAFGIIVAYSMYMYNFIHKPLSRLVKAFKQVETGEFNVLIEHRHDDEFRYIYSKFNIMAENLKNLIDQVYRQRILAQKAELKQLQSQINPHFLYNSFFILNTMTRIGDYDNLERFTNQLGEYFQFITRSAADEIELSKEVNHARVYTEIQSMRFSNRIKIEFDSLPDKFSKVIVPRLILQPIIENAFGHGLEKKTANGLLKISFLTTVNEIYIVVEDNGEELDDKELGKLKSDLLQKESKGEVTAIININQRIKLKFGEESGLAVMRGEMGGLKVTIHIKLIESGDINV